MRWKRCGRSRRRHERESFAGDGASLGPVEFPSCARAACLVAQGEAIAAAYGEAAILLDAQDQNAVTGNCIALTPETVFISEQGADSLRPSTRSALQKSGFALCSVGLDGIEKAGGSLRCCVAEIF